MGPITVTSHISAPREEIFDFLADLANRPAHCDHYMLDYRLARAKSTGLGAAARFKLRPPFAPKSYVEVSLTELERPRRVVEEGRHSRYARSRVLVIWELAELRGVTRVELSIETQPGTRWDAFKETWFVRGWLRRQAKKSVERLRMIFEERPAGELARVTVAGYESFKAPRFGASRPVAAPTRAREGSG